MSAAEKRAGEADRGERASTAALDGILSRTGRLLLDFDGPICSLFAGTPTAPVADRLRDVLTRPGIRLPPAIKETSDWFKILSFAASVGPDVGAGVEAELARLECRAVGTAAPAAHARDVLAACGASARSIAVVSNNSAQAVRSYLAAHGLDGMITVVAARTGNDPAKLKPSPYLIETAAAKLAAATSECAVVGDSPADIQAARSAGARGIGYAQAPADRERLAAAGAGAIISTMAELALSLRAPSWNPA